MTTTRRSALLVLCLFLSLSVACSGTPDTPDTVVKPAAPADVPKDASSTALSFPTLDVPYETFTLGNGLRVIVHEDHKTPVVAVNVWYHVGSKNEPDGRSGFAHLFEHLMFQGSENYKGEYFEPFEKVGATDMNGTTNYDRTNYFENVPTPALDVALWMESDRMGHFQGAINKALLDEQRGVVQNEKRQGLNRPYGRVWELLPDYLYPKGHPYSHSVIGSMEDLNAASVDDVRAWFKQYYAPSNAVLVLAGDITLAEARVKAESFFGDIPGAPAIERPDTWVAPMTESTRLVMKDEVPQARVYKSWNVPEWKHADRAKLDLVAAVLADGKNSRLYKRLVYEDQSATDVSAFVWSNEISSTFMIIATARPGESLAGVEKAVDEELARLLKDGMTDGELNRAKMDFFSSGVYGSERVGGFGGKSDILAKSLVLGGSPDAWKMQHETTRAATPADVTAAANTWLTKGNFTIEVHPSKGFDDKGPHTNTPKRNATADPAVKVAPTKTDVRTGPLVKSDKGVDRSKLPTAGTPPNLVLPKLQRATLSNGLKIVLAERHESPVVRMKMTFAAGYAADQRDKLGVASLGMAMLDEGTESASALEISGRLQDLGASVSTGSSIDTSSVSLSALSATVAPSVKLFAEIITTPAFADKELERLRKQTLAQLQQEQSKPVQNALRLLGPLMFGDDHSYGVPLTGSGTEASVKAISRDDLVAFHQQWLRPDKATLVVVGDTDLETLKPLLEEAFASWKAPTDAGAEKRLPAVKNPAKSRVFLVNKPGAEQSVIIGGLVAPSRSDNDIPLKLANGVLGGQFTARLNMNLREDKHWAYGSYSFIWSSANQRLLGIYAPVQTDKTSESLAELNKELKGIVGKKPPTKAEVDRLRDNFTLKLPGQNETTTALLGNITEIVEYGLPDDYWQSYVTNVRGLPLSDVVKTTKAVVAPKQVTWIVVGDLEKIQPKIKKLKLGKVEVLTP